jgi:hypothetical protein
VREDWIRQTEMHLWRKISAKLASPALANAAVMW